MAYHTKQEDQNYDNTNKRYKGLKVVRGHQSITFLNKISS